MMKKLCFVLYTFFILASCGSTNCPLQPRSPSSNMTCDDPLDNRLTGLVPETDLANTIIIGSDGKSYIETLLELYNKIDPETQVILLVVEDIKKSELLSTLKRKKNVKVIKTKNLQGSVWVRDWVPQKVILPDRAYQYVSLSYHAVQNSHVADSYFVNALKLPHYRSWLSGEMGNIMVDGSKRLYTTQRLLDDNVSPQQGITRAMVIEELQKAFNVEQVVVFPEHPLDGSIGHVDFLAKYIGSINGKETVLVSDSENPSVKKILDKVARKFISLGLKVIRIEELDQMIGKSVPGFINSLIFNNKVYMPIYSAGMEKPSEKLLELEKRAIETYQSLGFEVITINALAPLSKGRGAIHCLTSSGYFNLY